MKLIEKKENKIIFSAEIDESLANAIRRYVNQIPIFAIDEVEISKNDSPLYDETIAHRIGLIPLKQNKADEKKVLKLKLATSKEGIVYSGELTGNLKVSYDKIPITILNRGQELEVVAIAKAGKGSEHSKFSPGLMFYRNLFEIKIDKECPKEVTESCPQNLLKLKDGKVVAEDVFKCDMCGSCVDFFKKRKKEQIEITPAKEVIISIESFGQIDEKEIFKESVKALKKDLAEVSKKIEK